MSSLEKDVELLKRLRARAERSGVFVWVDNDEYWRLCDLSDMNLVERSRGTYPMRGLSLSDVRRALDRAEQFIATRIKELLTC